MRLLLVFLAGSALGGVLPEPCHPVATHITTDGCFRTNTDIGLDAGEECLPDDHFAFARCCASDGVCQSEIDDRCSGKLTFDGAKEFCASIGKTLCTTDQLAGNVCCDTGCNYDLGAVWTRDDCGVHTSSHVTMDGCSITNISPNTLDHGKQCYENRRTAVARCCPSTGQCESTLDNVCSGQVTYDAAERFCERMGMSLCSEEQLDVNACCGSGCDYDFERVWTRDSCHESETSFHITTDGCPTTNVGSGLDTEDECLMNIRRAAVRCCDQNGNCETEISNSGSAIDICSGMMTYDEAVQFCEEIGKNLCSAAQLSGGDCCGTGCSYDHSRVWTREACDGENWAPPANWSPVPDKK